MIGESINVCYAHGRARCAPRFLEAAATAATPLHLANVIEKAIGTTADPTTPMKRC